MNYLLRLFFVLLASHALQINLFAFEKNNISVKPEKRLALVIGNSSYPESSLRNPVNDAMDMAIALRKLGFDVIEKTNANQKDTNLAIAQFGERITTETVALFYYAGHGLKVKGRNYIVPIDANITSEASIRAMAVDLDTITDQLAASKINIIILDACRNNPFERRFRGSSGGLAQMEAPKGTFIAYATAPGKVANDGDGRNGLYTAELLNFMQIPDLTLEAVFKSVRNNVMKKTGESQTPWESSSLTGDFFFKPISKNSPSTNQSTQYNSSRSQEQIEDETWDTIKYKNKADLFQVYLKEHPNGRYVSQAKIRLVEINESTKPALISSSHSSDIEKAVTTDEDRAWFIANKNPTEASYSDFLKKFPDQKYSKLANAELLRYKFASNTVAQSDNTLIQPPTNELHWYSKKLKGYWSGSGMSGGIELWNIKTVSGKVTGEIIVWNPICSKKDTFQGLLTNSDLTFEQDGFCPGAQGSLKLINTQPPFEFEGSGTAQGHTLTFKLKAVD